jgi:hypothetical protein
MGTQCRPVNKCIRRQKSKRTGKTQEQEEKEDRRQPEQRVGRLRKRDDRKTDRQTDRKHYRLHCRGFAGPSYLAVPNGTRPPPPPHLSLVSHPPPPPRTHITLIRHTANNDPAKISPNTLSLLSSAAAPPPTVNILLSLSLLSYF